MSISSNLNVSIALLSNGFPPFSGFFNGYLAILFLSPKKEMNTLASVPAPFSEPVVVITVKCVSRLRSPCLRVPVSKLVIAHFCWDHSPALSLLIDERQEQSISSPTSYTENSLVAFFDEGFLFGSRSRLIRPSSSFLSSQRSTGNLQRLKNHDRGG